MVCTHSVCVKGLYVQSSSSSNSSLNHGVIAVAGRIGLDHGVIAVAGRIGLDHGVIAVAGRIGLDHGVIAVAGRIGLDHGVIAVAGRIGLDHGVIAVAGRTGLEPQSTGQCSGFVHGPICPWFVRTVSVLKACTHSREDWA